MADPQPLQWVHRPADPEQQRTHPARELLEALRNGQPVEVEGAVIHGDLNLANLDYGHKLVIRNSVFTGHVDLSESRFARSVDLAGCQFQRELSLFGARIDGQLLLVGAKIRKGVREVAAGNFAHLEVSGRLGAASLESEVGLCFAHASVGASVEFDGAKIDGDLDLELARIAGHFSCKSMPDRRTEILGRVTLAGAAIEGEVRLDGAKIGGPSQAENHCEVLSLASAVVEGHVSCNPTDQHRTEILGATSFYGATLGGDVCLSGIKIGREAGSEHAAPIPGKLNLRNVRIDGNLFCQPNGRYRTEVLGVVSLFEAKVGGLVVLDAIKIGPEARSKYDPMAPGKLILQDAIIGGSVYCRAVENARAEVFGPVSLLRTRVGGSVAFQGAKIGREAQGLDMPAIAGRLDLSDAEISGDVYCNPLGIETVGYSYRTEVLGSVLLWGTSVGGDVFFDGVRIGREGQFPDVASMPGELNLRDADVVGDLFCSAVESKSGEHSYRAEIHGPVSLVGARVDGQVIFMGTHIGLAPPEQVAGPALNLQSAQITGGLYCGPRASHFTEVHGDVRTFAANVQCAVQFDRARIHGDLNMERTVINGPLVCASDEDRYLEHPVDGTGRVGGHFQVDGRMILTGTEAQDVVVDGRLFGAPSQLRGLAGWVARTFVFCAELLVFFLRLFTGEWESSEARAKLRLDRARVSKLRFKEAIPDRIHADGILLADLELPGRPFEYTEFLKRTQPFRKSTYLSLERLLLNKGLDGQAARVYIEMSKRDLLLGRNLPERWFRWLILGIPMGYGARPSRLFWFILLTFLLTAFLFTSPDSLVTYQPSSPGEPCPLTVTEIPWETTLHVALRNHFPMFHFIRGNPYYVASTNPIPELPELLGCPRLHVTYRMYALVISAMSWVVVPLWLAGLTGIVRRRR